MNCIRKLVTYFGMALLVAGCTFMQQDFDKYGRNYDDVPIGVLSDGDSRSDVIALLVDPDRTIGSIEIDQCSVEVWEYQKWHASIGSDSIDQRYWLYFLGDAYHRWTSSMDWQTEARRICADSNL